MKKKILYGNANYEEIVSKNGYSDYGFDSSTQPEVDAIIKNHYNGYHFIKPSGEAVYNSTILVEPRVVVFYLSQIFFPLPERFSIAHDFVLSSSLFTPWTTIPSILFMPPGKT